jgi:DNA protecting protein DprA
LLDDFEMNSLQIHRVSTSYGNLWARTGPSDCGNGSFLAQKLIEKSQTWGLAVVGTRRPDAFSKSFLERTLASFEGLPLVIVSGLATGIDAWAHELALEIGLPTLAVLAHGLDAIYPQSSQRLADRILDSGGALLSEYPVGTPPLPFRFIARNQWIARLARATWVVQAPIHSGALHTARFCIEEDKPLFVTACRPQDPATEGQAKLWEESDAIPVFGSHSFGAEWIRCAGLNPNGDRERSPLEIWLARQTEVHGAVSAAKFHEECQARSWGPEVWEELSRLVELRRVRALPGGWQTRYANSAPS